MIARHRHLAKAKLGAGVEADTDIERLRPVVGGNFLIGDARLGVTHFAPASDTSPCRIDDQTRLRGLARRKPLGQGRALGQRRNRGARKVEGGPRNDADIDALHRIRRVERRNIGHFAAVHANRNLNRVIASIIKRGDETRIIGTRRGEDILCGGGVTRKLGLGQGYGFQQVHERFVAALDLEMQIFKGRSRLHTD